MTDLSTPDLPSHHARHADARWLAGALGETRARSLAMLAAWRIQNGDELGVAYDPSFNPMRWELGHVGWFESWWLARNPDRAQGTAARHDAPRAPASHPHADAWYNSTTVEHRARWSLALPPIDAIVDDVTTQRAASETLLKACEPGDAALYFFRLALLHEDMHNEAWAMMAQALGIDPGDDLSRRAATTHAGLDEIDVPTTSLDLASPRAGFAFDNERARASLRVPAFSIDAAPVSWSRFLPFVHAGGYTQRRWWTEAGWAWRVSNDATHPRYLRPGDPWRERRFDRWIDVDPDAPASHLTLHEALAWCRWAGRALASETQWCAAQAASPQFAWGDVWEWTSTAFSPFDGFEPHPYREYSQPWFDGRPVLKGASRLTHLHMAHPAYRNFFQPHRNDVMAGFRSSAKPPP